MTHSQPRLTTKNGVFSIEERGKDLYGASPRSTAEQKTKHIDIKPKTIVILAAPLLGYGIQTLLSRLPEDCVLLGIEPSKKYDELTRSHLTEMEEAGKRFFYAGPQKCADMETVFNSLGPHRFRRTQLVFLNRGYAMNREVYDRIHTALDVLIEQYWKNRSTLIFLGKLFTANIYKNVGRNYSNAAFLRRQFTSNPVFVAGAGVSLESSFSYIAKNRQKLFLLAVDTALPSLLEAGIDPDAVVVQESQWANIQDFIPAGKARFDLFCDLTSFPGINRTFGRKLHYYITRFADSSIFKKLRKNDICPLIVPPLGSVGITAVWIALAISSSIVITGGLDFFFPPGKTHAKGTYAFQAALRNQHRLQPAGSSTFLPKGAKPVATSCASSMLDSAQLALYARQYKLYLENNPRLYHHPEITRFREKRPPDLGHSQREDQKHYFDSVFAAGAGGAFLRGEKKDIANLISTMRGLLLSRGSGGLTDFRKKIPQFDYLFRHFPDYPFADGPDHGTIKRCLVSAGYYHKLLDTLC